MTFSTKKELEPKSVDFIPYPEDLQYLTRSIQNDPDSLTASRCLFLFPLLLRLLCLDEMKPPCF